MNIILQPKQGLLSDLLKATGPHAATIIGGGGAKGGGKSAGADDIAVEISCEIGHLYPGFRITIVRRVSRDLQDNHISKILQRHPDLNEYWWKGDNELRFDNRSTIAFRASETKEDVRSRFMGGYESAIIIIDEAQQFDQDELQWIQAAARWTENKGGIPQNFCKTLMLFNPGGKGGDYIRRIFWTHEYEKNERAKDYAFVHIFGWDNYEWFRGQVDISEDDFYQIPGNCQGTNRHEERCCRFHMFITETSEGRKYDAFPASIRAGYLLGSFDHFEGQYFAGAWDASRCMISSATANRMIQPWWTHWQAMDWGWAGPPNPHYSVNLWFAHGKLSPEKLREFLKIESDFPIDAVVVYRERHACLTPEPEWAQIVVDATPKEERASMCRHFVDGAVFSTSRLRPENTIADLMVPIFEEAGFPQLVPADKDRIGGWRQVYNGFLRSCIAHNGRVEELLDGPILLVSADCAELARSIPQVICDPDRPEDVLKTESIKDDYCDDLRYGYKSMQAAQWEAPVEVRRRELVDSYVERGFSSHGLSDETMSNMAMAMRRFDSEERNRYKRTKRRR